LRIYPVAPIFPEAMAESIIIPDSIASLLTHRRWWIVVNLRRSRVIIYRWRFMVVVMIMAIIQNTAQDRTEQEASEKRNCRVSGLR